jgi:carboxypeptidase family protein
MRLPGHPRPIAFRSAVGRAGTPVRVLALTVLIALCAMLVPAAAGAIPITGISGEVTNGETHTGIEGAGVCLYEEDDILVKCVPNATNANGEYTVVGLTEGNYRVEFSATGFATQYYSNASSLEESTTVHVTESQVTPNIDAGLEETGQGTVSGRATSASTGQGAGGIRVCASDGSPCTETNANGEYTISNLRVGSFSVSFSSAATACEEEQGEKVRCESKANFLSQSVVVKVKANQTETVNVALQVGGQISGTVTNASITHPGIGKIEVCATKVSGSSEYDGGECTYTNSSGQYTVSDLESGSYKLEFDGYICSMPKQGERECPEVYVTSYYHGKQTHKAGETVSVTAGSNTTGINETLREAFPSTPASSAAPTLAGTAMVGDVLSCSQGTWSHEPTYLIYQWLRAGTVISGQTGATYTLRAADEGHSIICSVTAGNGAGATSATSGAVMVAQPLVVSSATASVKSNTALLKLSCTGGGACVGTLKLVVRARGKHDTRSITIGQANFSIAAGVSTTIRVHLTSKGASLLRKAGKHGLKVTLSGSGVKGRTLALKMAKATKHGKK